MNKLVPFAAIAALLLATMPALADNPDKSQVKTRDTKSPGTEVKSNFRGGRTGLDPAKMGRAVRVSQLIGHEIQNGQGKNVGEIEDIVIDPQSGKIRYAAVTYGGFLGLGDKLFAVPYEAFQCRPDPDDSEDHIVQLNVTQQQLEGAVGFDQDHWPNFADKDFVNELDTRYQIDRSATSTDREDRIQRRTERRKDRDVDVDVNRKGVDVDVDRDAPRKP